MLQGGDDGDAAGVDEAAVVGEDVAGCKEGPDAGAGEEAQGFGGEGGRAADGDFKEAGEVGFEVCLSVGACWFGVWGGVIWGLIEGGIMLVGGRISVDGAYRPTSKAGEAMGESSVFMVKMPSNFRSGKGAVMVAEMRVRTLIHYQYTEKKTCVFRRQYLVFPNVTSTTPYSSPNESSRLRNAARGRPSMRIPSCRAWRMKARSLREGSTSRGMLDALLEPNVELWFLRIRILTPPPFECGTVILADYVAQ